MPQEERVKTPQDVLAYWLDEVGPAGWYAGGEALDQEVREKFLPLWERIRRAMRA